MKNLLFITFLFLNLVLTAQQVNRIRVKPKEIHDVLTNPGIGFTTFQRFNGDTLNPGPWWTEGYPIEYQTFDGNLKNEGYPQTSIAYFRVNWKFVEPEQGKYNWEMIDKALKTANERNQTLMLRISPFEDGDKDVPYWYRKMVGPEKPEATEKWRVDPEDARYLQYFGGMIKALGDRYDGHPGLEAVDISITGFWGEGDGFHLLSDPTRIGLLNCYLDHFKKTGLIYQPLNGDAPEPGILVKGTKIEASWPDGSNNGTGADMHPVGYRCDCLGDLSTTMWEEKQWSHMGDIYPRDIVKSGMYESWKKSHLSFEICYTFQYWLDSLKYTDKEIDFIFGEALKWHISSFNAKSSAVPEVWKSKVDQWLNKMGYRYVVHRFEYPSAVKRNGKLDFTSLWENVGVAPIYKPYRFALRLKNKQHEQVLVTSANLLTWLPGDIVHDESLFLPKDIPLGKYQLEIALIDPVYLTPKVKIAIDGKQADDWYKLGEITVED